MLSLQTLTNIEALLLSRSHPGWGEFTFLAQTLGEVQAAKQMLTQSRLQPAPPNVNVSSVGQTGGVTAATVPEVDKEAFLRT